MAGQDTLRSGLTNVVEEPQGVQTVQGNNFTQSLQVNYTADRQTHQGTMQLYGIWVTLFNASTQIVGFIDFPRQQPRRVSGGTARRQEHARLHAVIAGRPAGARAITAVPPPGGRPGTVRRDRRVAGETPLARGGGASLFGCCTALRVVLSTNGFRQGVLYRFDGLPGSGWGTVRRSRRGIAVKV